MQITEIWIKLWILSHLKVTSATKQLFKMYYLRHRFRIFLFCREVMFCSIEIQVFVFQTIPWFTKSVTSCSVLVHETVHFWIYLLDHNSLSHQTSPIDRYKQRQWFLRIFWTICKIGAKFQVLFNLAAYFNYSITNFAKIPVFRFLKKVNKAPLRCSLHALFIFCLHVSFTPGWNLYIFTPEWNEIMFSVYFATKKT